MFSVTSIAVGFNSVYGTKEVQISMNDNPSNVRIVRSNGLIEVTDTTRRFRQTVSANGIQAIVATGGNGNDRIVNDIVDVQLRAFGLGGDDYLEGYNAVDVLDGGDGNDTLVGYGGNDRLIGGNGNDTLRGMNGDDYLHGGSGKNTLDGGTGTDTYHRDLLMGRLALSSVRDSRPCSADSENTVRVGGDVLGPNLTGDCFTPVDNDPALPPEVISGAYLNEQITSTTRDSQWDIKQDQSPTCAFLASLSAYAGRTGTNNDLVLAIRYNRSTDTYGVPIFHGGQWTTQWVNGDWTEGRDPGGRLWVTLYQKAYLQAWGVQTRGADGSLLPESLWTSPNGTGWQNASNALDALTPGVSRWTPIASALHPLIRADLTSDATFGMVATTKDSGTTDGVVADHTYTLVDAFTENGVEKVRLYNPWGRDQVGTPADGKNDGLITLTMAQFRANFSGYVRNSAGLKGTAGRANPDGQYDGARFTEPLTSIARFRRFGEWSDRAGGGFAIPNFEQADYGQGTVFGSTRLLPNATVFQDIPAAELGNPDGAEARFRAMHRWADGHGYVSAVPTFQQAAPGGTVVFGAYLLRPGSAIVRDIPASELGNPTNMEERFRAINRWASNHGYAAGYPNFEQADYGQGTVYGAVLVLPGSADHIDIPAFLVAGTISLRTGSGFYVVAEGGGGKEMKVNRTAAGPWESFTVEYRGGDQVALRANNGQYVVAEGGGGGAVNADRANIGPWETFTVVRLGGNRIALRTINGRYLCAEGGGNGALVADRLAIGGWETFEFATL